ncbi:MAG: hypothetical protein JJ864_13240 [Rhizobiaceae bacterium]|nr:hypothetical protein [Rhizobiaceae bacterium]
MRHLSAASDDKRNRLTAPCLAVGLSVLLMPSASLALSELPEENIEPAPEIITVPLPPPISGPEQTVSDIEDDEDSVAPQATETPEVYYDLERLPEPVRRMRGLIIDACKAGDIEALRPLLGNDESRTQVSSGGGNFDPVEFLKDISGDGEGHEILAILLEVLEAGYVHLDPGEPEEIYLWPYFFAVPLEGLSGPQRVELFKLVTAGDYEDMKSFGAYIFYRVGITPEGRWAFFLAGH